MIKVQLYTKSHKLFTENTCQNMKKRIKLKKGQHWFNCRNFWIIAELGKRWGIENEIFRNYHASYPKLSCSLFCNLPAGGNGGCQRRHSRSSIAGKFFDQQILPKYTPPLDFSRRVYFRSYFLPIKKEKWSNFQITTMVLFSQKHSILTPIY